MKGTLVALLLVAACDAGPVASVRIDHPPPMIPGLDTDLAVPESCPIYSPNGGDTNTPEWPYPDAVHVYCGVDSAHVAYGLITGDTGDLAILPGGGELGIYIDYIGSVPFDPEELDANVKAWAAPINVLDGVPEGDEANRIPIVALTAGSSGLLLSFGSFDDQPTQVSLDLVFGGGDGWWSRFYVNDVPPLN